MKHLNQYLGTDVAQQGAAPTLQVPVTEQGPRQTKHVFDPRIWPKSFLIVVVLPVLLAVVYFGFLAAPRYISHAEVVIRSSEGGGNALGVALSSLAGGLGGGGGLATTEAEIMAQYVLSQSMLRQLQEEVDLRSLWTRDAADIFSRLPEGAPLEQFLNYYRNRIVVESQPGSTVMSISAEAFTPEDAQAIVTAIVRQSETVLNALSNRQQSDSLSFAREELAAAEARVRDVRLKKSAFRERYGEVDPTQSASATGQMVMGMAQQLVEARSELAMALNVMKPTSPEVKAIKTRISVLESQIKKVRARMAPTAGDAPINTKLVEWEVLETEHELAMRGYEAAVTFLEAARVKASQQGVYIVDFVPANRPEAAEEPKRIKNILAVAVGAFLLWAIGGLLMTAIREQARG